MSDGWSCHQATLAAEAPIHIGWHDLGTVQRTRYYIPARNIWGVLVARLAPMVSPGASGDGIYARAQERVKRCLRPTYFFPAGDADGGSVWRPRFDTTGRRMGSLREWDFERRFLTSQTATALNAQRLSAEDGALHESEYLCPGNGGSKPLFFVGYLLVRRDVPVEWLNIALRECAVGADRRYGWGRLRLVSLVRQQNMFGDFEVREWPEGRDPVVVCRGESRTLPAHVLYSAEAKCFEGELEPVAGREWEQNQGSGRKITQAELCWAPGSRFLDQAEPANYEFHMLDRGLWDVGVRGS